MAHSNRIPSCMLHFTNIQSLLYFPFRETTTIIIFPRLLLTLIHFHSASVWGLNAGGESLLDQVCGSSPQARHAGFTHTLHFISLLINPHSGSNFPASRRDKQRVNAASYALVLVLEGQRVFVCPSHFGQWLVYAQS